MKGTIRVLGMTILSLLSVAAWGGATGSNDPHANSPRDTSDGCGCGSSNGMPVYSFKSMLAGLSLRDTPLSYTPPVGPAMNITLFYNARETDQPDTFNAFNLGRKWTLNWLTYIQDDPDNAGDYVKRYVAGGGAELYRGYDASTGAFDPEQDDAAVLVRTSGSPITYELRYADGSKDVFSISDGETGYPRKVFLTRKVDAQGNVVTLRYDDQLRLTSVTDAIGQSTTFRYDNDDRPLEVTGFTGPFGRIAAIGYDEDGRLTSITDAIGMTSSFKYGDDTFINSMTTPYGTTTFKQTHGVGSRTEYSVQATDPMGHTERTEYRHNAPGIAFSANDAPRGMTVRNAYINYRNSFYWDKSTYASACQEDNGSVSCDYTRARIKHFLHNPNASSQTARAVESIKYPLESRLWYRYPNQRSPLYNGSLNKPTRVGRVLENGDSRITSYRYNDQGKVTQRVGPNGREIDYTYAANGIDLVRVERKTGSGSGVLAQYTYNDQHRPLNYTDAAGETTTYTYNARGQRNSATDPLGNKTTYNYDAGGYLTSITNALGHTQYSFAYDDEGRLASDTDSEGYTRGYQYDALNRVTAITYPDGTRRSFTWDRLDLASMTDREGRTTTFTYDANRHLIARTDPMGQITRYTYYANGRLKTLTDGNGNTTTWTRDLEGRVTAKTYADGNGTTFTYDVSSRLASKTDALGQTTNYTYTVADLLAGIDYTNAVNPTLSVQFTYDPDYRRVTAMTDGHGATQYAYYPAGEPGAGQIQSEQGDNTHDRLEYTYDELGRRISRTVDGNTEALTYDALGRLSSDANALGSFTETYLGDTSQRTLENAEDVPYQVAYQYEENLNDRRLKAILNDRVEQSGTSPVMDYKFTSSPEGLILSRDATDTIEDSGDHRHDHGHHWGWHRGHHWGHSHGSHWGLGWFIRTLFGGVGFGHGWHNPGRDDDHDSGSTATQYQYDDALRLTGVEKDGTVNYIYDAADNLVEIKGGDQATQITVNSLNQIQTRDDRSYRYDANGNLVDDGQRSYTWDAADRLLTITDQDTGHVTTFGYDGLSRRVLDTETDADGSTTITHNLWCGQRLCERRADDDTVIARYFDQGEVQKGTPYLYAKDQVGSVVALIDASGQVAGRVTYDAYGNIIDQSGVQPGYVYAGLYYHPDSGIYFATYRAYDASTGKWLSRDPVRETANLNLYAYSKDSPTIYSDRLGLWSSTLGGYAGIGGELTFGNDNGTGFITIRFGFGFGGGVSYDPNGEIPGPIPNNRCKGGVVLSASGQAGFTAGPLNAEIEGGAARNYSNEESALYGGPSYSFSPSFDGLSGAASLGGQVTFY